MCFPLILYKTNPSFGPILGSFNWGNVIRLLPKHLDCYSGGTLIFIFNDKDINYTHGKLNLNEPDFTFSNKKYEVRGCRLEIIVDQTRAKVT